MDLLVFAGLFIPVMLSGLSILAFRMGDKALKLLTAFSGAYLLSISFLHIIPEIFEGESDFPIGLFVLLGFLIQLLLDFLTKGIEHGHLHNDCKEHGHPHNSVSPIAVMIGICIHSFLEGMPLADVFNEPELKKTMLTGIIIHNIPISIVLMSLLLQSKYSIKKSILLLAIFALSGPLGVISVNFTGTAFIAESEMIFKIAMALVIGIFLHISTTILFETDEHHHFNLYKFLTIILGAGLAFVL